MAKFPYQIVVAWSEEDRAFVARVPALPGCAAHGPSPEKALKEVQVAAGLVLEVMKEEGRIIPHSDIQTKYSGQLRLRMPRSLHARLAEEAALEAVSLNQLLVARLAGKPSRIRMAAKGEASGRPAAKKRRAAR